MSKKVSFVIDNMNCGSCVRKIETAMESFKADTTLNFSVEQKTLDIVFSPEQYKAMNFKKSIEEAGFKISKMETSEI